MSENKKPAVNPMELRARLLLIGCCVLAFALIVVSAFAYQWKTENNDLKKQVQTLRAINDPTALTTLSDEVGTLSMEKAALESERDAYKKQVEEYKTMLEENGLLETEDAE